MKNTIEINLQKVQNPDHIFSRFINSLGLVTVDGFEDITEKTAIKYSEPYIRDAVGWDAFEDDLSTFKSNSNFKDFENLEIHLVITGWNDVKKILSKDEENMLMDIIHHNTDPNYRLDGLKKLTFEIREDE